MKRVGFIYENIYSVENVRQAILNASKGKSKKPMVKWVNKNFENVLNEIVSMLENENYTPSPYFESIIKDGISKKERIIYKPKFYPDQIIHWCLMQQITPLIMRGMYNWSCASISKRGVHYAKKYVEKHINDYKYCLKLDIKKFYPSIDKEILKKKFGKIIKCKRTLNLISSIIDSHHQGIPIGNYTSQWFANFYLQDLDHFIKEKLGVKVYVRYMDDLVLLGNNKRVVNKWFVRIKEKVESENLEIKGNYQLFNCNRRNLDFCGFVYSGNKTFIRKGITRKMRRAYFKFNKTKSQSKARSLISYYGWVKHTDSYILYKKYFNNLKQIKEETK